MVARQTLWAAIAFLAAGCAFRSVGFVESADDHTVLMEADGERHRLALGEGAIGVAHLDGHMVEIVGRRGFGRIRVVAWRAIEGPHGMPVWAGPVQRSDRRVGILDLASGELLWVDDEVAPELAPYAGDLVAAEGYLDHDRLVVLHWLPLVDAPTSGQFRP